MNLLVSDFDETFYDENYKENLEFVKELKNTDFIINTGRDHIMLFKKLKIECNYYILGDGSYIMDKNKNIIYIKPINNNIINKLKEKIKVLNYDKYSFISFDNKVAKIEIKIKDKRTAESDLKYLLDGLDNVYGYVSRTWINIMSNEARKEIALKYIENLTNYDKIYTVGDGPTDYNMLKEYNGFLINKKQIKGFNCINNFLELKYKIKD